MFCVWEEVISKVARWDASLPLFRFIYYCLGCFLFQFLFCSVRGVSLPLPGAAARRMVWKWLGALVVFPLQMIYLVAKAAVGLVLPAKLRDLSRENVLITGGGRGIGRQLAREFAARGARKVPGTARPGGGGWRRGKTPGAGVRPPAAAAGTRARGLRVAGHPTCLRHPRGLSWSVSPCTFPGHPTVFFRRSGAYPLLWDRWLAGCSPLPRKSGDPPFSHIPLSRRKMCVFPSPCPSLPPPW